MGIRTSNKTSNSFLKSALNEEGSYISTSDVIRWLNQRNLATKVVVDPIPFKKLNNWVFDPMDQNLKHTSGKFFSIDGIHVKTNWGYVSEWQQPIINQPEIGYLGIITKEIDGILYFLMQAKIEPGNINAVQLSPTLQATKSNYTQVHKGKEPLYLNYFRNASMYKTLLDQLQSEQGARFIKKRNRNIIIQVQEDFPIHENFIWLTLGQIKKLIQFDNLINMDTRTVISGISLSGSAVLDLEQSDISFRLSNSEGNSLYEFDEIIHWVTDLKSKYELNICKIPLDKINSWEITENEIRHVDGKFFSIIAAQIVIGNREVETWSQPLLKPAQQGLIAFILKKINGTIHFLVQGKLECGNFDIIELAPTVQCLTGNYRETPTGKLPFLEYVLNTNKSQIISDTLQSEEGGRFYHEQNRNLIILADDSFPVDLPENYIWMTLEQLMVFIKFNNYINIQARSLIAGLQFKI